MKVLSEKWEEMCEYTDPNLTAKHFKINLRTTLQILRKCVKLLIKSIK